MKGILIGAVLTAALFSAVYFFLAHICSKKAQKANEVEKDSKQLELSIQSMLAEDQLAMYKDCLDQGIITQEEFDAKKKQLHNM